MLAPPRSEKVGMGKMVDEEGTVGTSSVPVVMVMALPLFSCPVSGWCGERTRLDPLSLFEVSPILCLSNFKGKFDHV